MRLSVRLLTGIVVVGVLGFVWTSSDEHDARPEGPNEYATQRAIEPAIEPIERTPPHVGTRARASGNAGGLPARGAPAAGRSPSARSAAATTTTPPPVAPAAAPSGATSPASGAPRRVLRESTPMPIAIETADQPASGADAAAPEKERERARGIAGSVLEKGGAPAAGLAVNLKTRRVFSGAPSAPQTRTTDARGGFAFGAVADGEYEIYVDKSERYERAAIVVRSGLDAAVLIVEPAAENSLAIRGVVESSRGGALAGVRVEAIGQASSNATTDAKGAYALRVPAGSRVEQTELRFRRPGYRDRRWTIADGLRSSDYEVIGNVRLDPDAAGVSVTGVVTSTGGAPVARAQVQLNSATRGRSYRAVSDGDGRFTLQNVEAGADYRLWARAQSGFKDGLLENVLVDAATQLAIELTPIGTATLKGRMVTPEGAAVPGFTLFLATANAGAPRSASVTSDGQGRFLVANLPEGRVSLQTRAAPAISVSGIELSAGTPETDVTVVVDVGPHRLEGQLTTSDGTAAAGVNVSLEWSASTGSITSRSTRQTTTDADGNFAFTQLGGGPHIVNASLAGAGSVRLEQSIGPGLQPIQIALPGKRGRQ